jgi:hypothetical protein
VSGWGLLRLAERAGDLVAARGAGAALDGDAARALGRAETLVAALADEVADATLWAAPQPACDAARRAGEAWRHAEDARPRAGPRHPKGAAASLDGGTQRVPRLELASVAWPAHVAHVARVA